jgi:hypothetical protein
MKNKKNKNKKDKNKKDKKGIKTGVLPTLLEVYNEQILSSGAKSKPKKSKKKTTKN